MWWFPYRRGDWAVSSAYFIAYVCLGLINGALGPAIVSLAEHTDSDVDKVSLCYTSRGMGQLFGSWVGGLLIDARPTRSHHVLCCGMLLMAAATLIVPIVPWVWVLIVVQGGMGVGAGVLDVTTQSLIVWIWKEEVNPKMQLLHFSFGVGAFVAPIIIAPVIKSSLFIPYSIIAVMVIVGALVPLFFKPPPQPTNQESQKSPDQSEGTTPSPSPPSPSQLPSTESSEESQTKPPKQETSSTNKIERKRVLLITALVATFLFFNQGCEIGYGGYISAYAQKSSLNMDKDKASLLASAFWFCFTMGRLIAVGIMSYVKVHLFTVLLVDTLGSMAGVVLLVLLSNEPWAVWVISCVVGLFMASIFPTGMSLSGTVFGITVQGKDTALFVVGAAAGDLVIPAIIGLLFTEVGAFTLMWAVAIMFMLATVPYVFMVLISDWPSQLCGKGDKYDQFEDETELAAV